MKLTPLRMWVQSILPVVYDDSLSYYEMVSKINAKTNEIIEQVNANTHDIETLNMIIEKLGDPDELRALIERVEVIVNDLYTEDTPLMDELAGSSGVADHAARSDHVHPSDNKKADKNLGIISANVGGFVKVKAVSGSIPTEFESVDVDPLLKSGGTMSGDINMNSHVVTGLSAPVNNSDGSNKQYVDDEDIKVQREIAGVVNGKQSNVSIGTGEYVIVRNSAITGKADGIYIASQAIPANTDIDGSYLDTALTKGGLNSLLEKLKNFIKIKTVYINTWQGDDTTLPIAQGTQISATIDAGYKFLCWTFLNTSGWVSEFPFDIEYMTVNPTKIFWPSAQTPHLPSQAEPNPKIGLSYLEILDIGG